MGSVACNTAHDRREEKKLGFDSDVRTPGWGGGSCCCVYTAARPMSCVQEYFEVINPYPCYRLSNDT